MYDDEGECLAMFGAEGEVVFELHRTDQRGRRVPLRGLAGSWGDLRRLFEPDTCAPRERLRADDWPFVLERIMIDRKAKKVILSVRAPP